MQTVTHVSLLNHQTRRLAKCWELVYPNLDSERFHLIFPIEDAKIYLSSYAFILSKCPETDLSRIISLEAQELDSDLSQACVSCHGRIITRKSRDKIIGLNRDEWYHGIIVAQTILITDDVIIVIYSYSTNRLVVTFHPINELDLSAVLFDGFPDRTNLSMSK